MTSWKSRIIKYQVFSPGQLGIIKNEIFSNSKYLEYRDYCNQHNELTGSSAPLDLISRAQRLPGFAFPAPWMFSLRMVIGDCFDVGVFGVVRSIFGANYDFGDLELVLPD